MNIFYFEFNNKIICSWETNEYYWTYNVNTISYSQFKNKIICSWETNKYY